MRYEDGSNRITSSSIPGVDSTVYDNAGNLRFDGLNAIAYDAESRVCAIKNFSGAITQYLYNAEGQRVAKGYSASGSGLVCPTPGDFVATEKYILGPSGEQITQFVTRPDGSDVWQHTNVYANGQLIATYDQEGSQQLLHFQISDPLGTRRVQTSASGSVEISFLNLPYGDGFNLGGSGQDATQQHFTGKERDSESGLDYFGARYYALSMGRFSSPDPVLSTPLHILNPQRWNKYAYAINNPLSYTDPDGRDAVAVNFSKEIPIVGHQGIMSVRADGTATYARFGPVGGSKPTGEGLVQSFTLTTRVQFDANGQPTANSLNALKTELSTSDLSPEKGQGVGTIRLNYFKTSDAETANLDQYIKQQQEASDRGKSPRYNVVTNNCTMFCQRGLVAAGVLNQNQANHGSLAPNGFWRQLIELQSRQPCFSTSVDDGLGNKSSSGCQ
ncbi:MAG: hypothetical protein BGO25_08220 [Acidobacteriales bacterium 59-55]|nr:MAG: hypothetical protein BGO25_08220 [Acidobacteriales bacterium 59-55]